MTPSEPHYVLESGDLVAPALLVHGGAGTFERLGDEGARARLEGGLARALAAGWDVLAQEGGALRAAVEAVASLEDSGLFNAGRGSCVTSEGGVETDASVMDGGTGAAGAVASTTFPANPVRAALLVASLTFEEMAPSFATAPPGGAATAGPKSQRTGMANSARRPLLLAGPGADRLAEAAGLAPMPTRATTAPGTDGQTVTRGTVTGGSVTGGTVTGGTVTGGTGPAPGRGFSGLGTVGAVALDRGGHLGAATSTGGLAGKPPGRVGDSAIVGSGTWADDATVAVSATGVGEAFILAGFAHRVDWSVRAGARVGGAVTQALDAVSRYNGSGGAIALTPSGQFAAIFGTRAMARGWRSASELVVRI
jgi:L-asparaginase / beta-aspartyl-peptidase